jgi:hypothetical protein
VAQMRGKGRHEKVIGGYDRGKETTKKTKT